MEKEYIKKSLIEMIPSPKCELNYTSDYTLLIAILLSAQCLDKKVNKVTPILFSKYPTLLELKNANLKELTEIIRPLGLANNKAKAIIELSSILLDKYEGKVPQNREILTTLPGIGIKTSGVFLAEFYKHNYFPVDTHVKRVSYRLGLTNLEDNVNKIEETLTNLFKNDLDILHLRFVLFGRYICKSKNPECNKCKFYNKCIITRQNNYRQ